MLGADAGIVQTGRNGMRRRDLSFTVLQEVGASAVQHADSTGGQAGGVAARDVQAVPGRFYPAQSNLTIVDKCRERTHRV